jgi:F0F1-type ATP synthase membrane subunit b/b'
VSPTLTTFLFEAANFLVLAAVLGWLFFRPVREALNHRRHQLAGAAEQAQQKLAEAERAQREIEMARANLRQELQEMRTRELDAARAQVDQLLAQAQDSAQRELALAHAQAHRLTETQQQNLAQVAATAAAEAVERLLHDLAGTELHDALVRSACQQLRQLRDQAKGGHDPPSPPGHVTPGRLAPIKIELAQPPSAAQQAALDEALGPDASDPAIQIVPSLGAGVRISTGRGLIDASVGGLASFARQSLIRAMNHRADNHAPRSLANDV